MGSKDNQKRDSEKDEASNIASEWEYVYYQKESTDEYVINHENSGQSSTNRSSPEIQKPSHKRGEPGVYDELDYSYDLKPHTQPGFTQKGNENGKPVLIESRKSGGMSTLKKLIIGIIIGGLVIGAIFAGIIFALPG